VLRSSTAACDELQEEEVRTFQPIETEEEAKVVVLLDVNGWLYVRWREMEQKSRRELATV
jgi:hypothetical protein